MAALEGRSRRLLDTAAGLVLLTPALLFVVGWPLPLQDGLGHIGLGGGIWWHLNAPDALDAPLRFQGWLGPNRLLYLAVVPFSVLPSPVWAVQSGFVAAFGGFGLATGYATRALGYDWRISVLVVPSVLGRPWACGFYPNALALFPLFVLCLACFSTSRARGGWAAAAGVFAILTHVFVGYVALGFFALSILVTVVQDRRIPWLACGSLGGLLVLSSFLRAPDAGAAMSDGASVVEAVYAALGPHEVPPLRLWQWMSAWHTAAIVDDYAQAVWLIGLAGLLGLAFYLGRGHRLLAGALFGVCGLGVALLDEKIGPPVNWWGGWLRLPSIMTLVAAAFAATAFRTRSDTELSGPVVPSRAVAVLSAAALGGAFVLTMSLSGLVIRASRAEYAGLSRLIEAAPPKKRVCSMWYPGGHLKGFPGSSNWYAGNFYFASKGGNPAHSLMGNASTPFYRAQHGARGPSWGQARGFNYARHGGWCELFLVRTLDRRPELPFHRTNGADKVQLLGERGHWRLYLHRGLSPPGETP